jgi:membrane dipeptidase
VYAVCQVPGLYRLHGVDDVDLARKEGKLAITVNFRRNVLANDIGLVEVFYRLGVRHMLMAYNQNLAAPATHRRRPVASACR